MSITGTLTKIHIFDPMAESNEHAQKKMSINPLETMLELIEQFPEYS
jgi:hypothetical protein